MATPSPPSAPSPIWWRPNWRLERTPASRAPAVTAPHAFFLPTATPAAGQRLCILHPAQTATLRGRVVYVHPFAEEMNKSRRMAALGARALAQNGFSVLQIDLLGCGDSSGDFGDADWKTWVADVVQAEQWLRGRDARHAAAPLWLWGLRAGCLLAADAAAQIDVPGNFLFWQPSTAGKLLLAQFLRLKLASELQSGQSKAVMQALRLHMERGETVEIAGYRLAAGLAAGLETARLVPPGQSGGRLEWLEVQS